MYFHRLQLLRYFLRACWLLFLNTRQSRACWQPLERTISDIHLQSLTNSETHFHQFLGRFPVPALPDTGQLTTRLQEPGRFAGLFCVGTRHLDSYHQRVTLRRLAALGPYGTAVRLRWVSVALALWGALTLLGLFCNRHRRCKRALSYCQRHRTWAL
jgi:hypothetical protein